MTGNKPTQQGFTLLMAVLTSSVLLAIGAAIGSIAIKEAILTTSIRDSQKAFYAADAALECALYWDITRGEFNNPNPNITCSGENPLINKSGTVYTFALDFGDDGCANVRIDKDSTTEIETRGYNTCDSNSSRRLERGLRAEY